MFLSSHLMSEMALTADHLIIIGRGRLIRDISVGDVRAGVIEALVRVRSPQAAQLRGLVVAHARDHRERGARHARRRGLTAEQIGRIAALHGIVLFELTPQTARSRTLHGTHPRLSGVPQPSTNAGVTDAAGVAA